MGGLKMKRLLLTVLFISLLVNVTYSENLIVIESDSIPNNLTTVTIPVLWENSDTLVLAQNGFVVSTTGDITASFDGGNILPGSRLDGIPIEFTPGGPYSSLVFMNSTEPWPHPILPGPLHEAFELTLSVSKFGSNEGEICIDSAYRVGADGYWLWENPSFGVGTSFNDGNGPVCFDYFQFTCQDFEFTNLPANDTITGNHWYGVYFDFQASTNDSDYAVIDYEVTSGLGYFTNRGFYFDGGEIGSYPVTIAAYAECLDTIEYSFTVVLIEGDIVNQIIIESDSIVNNITEFAIPVYYENEYIGHTCNCFLVYSMGSITSNVDSAHFTLMMGGKNGKGCATQAYTSIDTVYFYNTWLPPILCGPIPSGDLRLAGYIYVSVDNYRGSGEGEIRIAQDSSCWYWEVYSSYPYFMTKPVFNGGSGPAVITYYQPPVFCGDANSDDLINVSDAVHLVAYIYYGGAEPYPFENGDANCDTLINVSDAVWIINYIFIGGNAPCDVDGDGGPDC
jgi:hypothetical protein